MLCATNSVVNRTNSERLRQLDGDPVVFDAVDDFAGDGDFATLQSRLRLLEYVNEALIFLASWATGPWVLNLFFRFCEIMRVRDPSDELCHRRVFPRIWSEIICG